MSMKNIFKKYTAIFISIAIFFQGIACYGREIAVDTTLQPETIFTRSETSDSFFRFTARYVWEYLLGIENDPRNQNVFRIRHMAESLIESIKNSKYIPRALKNFIPCEILVRKITGDILLDFGDYKIRYFNPNIEIEDAGVKTFYEKYDVIERKIGKYLVKEMLVSKELFRRSHPKQTVKDISSIQNKKPRNFYFKIKNGIIEIQNFFIILMEKFFNSLWQKQVIININGCLKGYWNREVNGFYSVRDIVNCAKNNGWGITEKNINELERIFGLYPDKINDVAQHALRVTMLSILIYSRLPLEHKKSYEEFFSLIKAGVSHDIGKRDGDILQIVSKNGSLTQEEREKIKQHIHKTLRILEANDVRLEPAVLSAIEAHHPWYNGKFPVEAIERILFISDQIDARYDVSRPYHPRTVKYFTTVKIPPILENFFHERLLDKNVYTAVLDILNNTGYKDIVTSTYAPYQKFNIKYFLTAKNNPKTIAPEFPQKKDLQVLRFGQLSNEELDRINALNKDLGIQNEFEEIQSKILEKELRSPFIVFWEEENKIRAYSIFNFSKNRTNVNVHIVALEPNYEKTFGREHLMRTLFDELKKRGINYICFMNKYIEIIKTKFMIIPAEKEKRTSAADLKILKQTIENNLSKIIPSLLHYMIEMSEKKSIENKQEKILLFIDTSNFYMDSAVLCRELERLLKGLVLVKENNKTLGAFLNNIEIKYGKWEKSLNEKLAIKGENTIIITGNYNNPDFIQIKGRGIIAKIDREAASMENIYIPVFETTFLAIAKYLKWNNKDMERYYKGIPNVIKVEDLSVEDYKKIFDYNETELIVRLVKNAEVFREDELIDIFSSARQFLFSA
ncbi:hypothetical protein OMAG_000052 [Candidatus Omnitrophus magneticus]|uniref:HD domain-containing protein n=1 Tax=Candidatus Omnitrophus magneticus TaxID=1609969 RepID=A0A0F0CRY6_9BACT|nr:hypothetical protein OMAG_000052 [Candidatus Omnitrophus magneticus]